MSLGHTFLAGSLGFVCVSFGSGSQFFCLGRYILSRHRLCVCGPGPLRSGAGFLFRSELFCMRFGTVRNREQGFCFKPSISVHGTGPFGSGSLFVVWKDLVRLREPVCSFVWSDILMCTRSGTVRLPGAVFCLRRSIYRVCSPGPLGSGSLYWSYLRSRTVFALGASFIFANDYCYTASPSILDPAYARFGIFRFDFRAEIYDI